MKDQTSPIKLEPNAYLKNVFAEREDNEDYNADSEFLS
jgi:hypothetical protein